MSMPRHRGDGLARRVILVALVLAAPSPAPASGATKPPRRLPAPVAVRPGLLAALPARETGGSRLYAVRQGRLEPIPFQFDARDPDGELVLSEAGDEAEFTFDDDDELVFMA